MLCCASRVQLLSRAKKTTKVLRKRIPEVGRAEGKDLWVDRAEILGAPVVGTHAVLLVSEAPAMKSARRKSSSFCLDGDSRSKS